MKKSEFLREDVVIILFFTILIFTKVISLNFSVKIAEYSNLFSIIGILGSVLILASFLLLFKGKGRISIFLVMNMAITLIILIDVIYNRYFSDITSIALIHQARLAGEVRESVSALLRVSDLKYFTDILLVGVLYFIILRKRAAIDKSIFKHRLISFLSVFTAGIILSGVSVYALEKDQPKILETFYDKKFVASRIGGLNFHAFDCYRYISSNVLKRQKISDSEKNEIKAWFNLRNTKLDNRYNGIMKGKNLIVVQLEAFQEFILNRKIGGQEITPNLNELAQESLVFSHFYYQTSWGGTSDAEFLSNVSLLPAREGSVYYQYAGNTYTSLAWKLKEEGYSTSVMHANRAGFWNRANMYKSLGFDSYESENSFLIDETQGLGLSDKSFYKQSVAKIKALRQPFYSFLISLSSHFPYKDEDDKIKNILNVGEFEGTSMGDYLKSVKYADEAIGVLIEELKKEGLWENSVIVFYGDHSAIPYDQRELLGKLVYDKTELTDLEWFNAQRVVSMIHFPEGEFNGTVDKPSAQVDLLPTLSNLFGFKVKYTLGQDILNSKNGFVNIRTGNWIFNNVIYLKSQDKVYDANSGQELNKIDYEEQFKIAEEYIKNSDAVIENDLLKYFGDG